MQKKMDYDGNLYDMDVTSEVLEYEVVTYSTNSYELGLKTLKGDMTKADALVDSLHAVDNFGGLKIPENEWKARLKDFIVKKMKPLVCNPTGAEFELSKTLFYEKLFGDFDRDNNLTKQPENARDDQNGKAMAQQEN